MTNAYKLLVGKPEGSDQLVAWRKAAEDGVLCGRSSELLPGDEAKNGVAIQSLSSAVKKVAETAYETPGHNCSLALSVTRVVIAFSRRESFSFIQAHDVRAGFGCRPRPAEAFCIES
jgi:hypothetical protein